MIVTAEYLRSNPDHIFVFGDNCMRVGKGGAASLRDEPNTYGFITKIHPDHDIRSFFSRGSYRAVLKHEMALLRHEIMSHPENEYLISKLGSGLANRHHIWDIIEPELLNLLSQTSNVLLLWLVGKKQ